MPNNKPLTVDDLPFDDPEGEAVDAAYELGQEWENRLVELYRLALEAALNCDGNHDALRALQQGIKYNPRHIIRAAKLWPALFDSDISTDSMELFAAFTIASKCKDDDDALEAHLWYAEHTPTLEELRAYLKEHYGAEGAKKMTLAERCAALVSKWRDFPVRYSMNIGYSVCADDLAAEPEVRRALVPQDPRDLGKAKE